MPETEEPFDYYNYMMQQYYGSSASSAGSAGSAGSAADYVTPSYNE